MEGFTDLGDINFWIRLPVCIVCGTIVGLERQLRGKPVGIRTSNLICLSTMAFVYLGVLVASAHLSAERILGQIVTGVGFVGAGVILTRDGLLLGVTSAAVVWLLAAVGSAIGFGKYGIAIVLSFVGIAILLGVEKLEEVFNNLRRGVHMAEGGETVNPRANVSNPNGTQRSHP